MLKTVSIRNRAVCQPWKASGPWKALGPILKKVQKLWSNRNVAAKASLGPCTNRIEKNAAKMAPSGISELANHTKMVWKIPIRYTLEILKPSKYRHAEKCVPPAIPEPRIWLAKWNWFTNRSTVFVKLFTEITVLLFREIFAAFGTARKFVKISETLFYTFCFLYISIQEYLTIYTVIWHLAKSKIYENFNALDRTRSSVFSIVCVN